MANPNQTNTKAGLGDSLRQQFRLRVFCLRPDVSVVENSVFIDQSSSEPWEWFIEHPPKVLIFVVKIVIVKIGFAISKNYQTLT
jgi:hypothetical protein